VRKLMCSGVVVLGLSGALAFGQDIQTRSKTKITVEEGREVTVTGCVSRSAEGAFRLSHVANEDGALGSYTLVGEDADDLEDLVGHRVEVKGKAADKGTGKVEIESRSEVDDGVGDTRKRESKTEVEGDLHGLPFLGVKSVRSLASVCP
jgi:hypothetical protein